MITERILREVLSEQREEVSLLEGFVDREAYAKLKQYERLPHAVVVSGIRRCGKSTLLKQFLIKEYGDDFYYVTFDDERLASFTLEDFSRLYQVLSEIFGQKKVFFLDEIQNVPGWERFVRRLYERGFKFYITGSNSTLLSKEFSTALTGRHILLTLYPFSYAEYLKFRGLEFKPGWVNLTEKRALLKRELDSYIESGGFPEYLKYGEKEVLRRIHDDIIYKDIIARYGLKEHLTLREMGVYLLTNVGNYFSYNKLKRLFGLGSPNTAKKYTNYLESSYVLETLTPFEYSLKKQLVALKKAYCSDTGLRNTIGLRFSSDRGRLMENIVYLHLKRMENEVFYYKKTSECDFIVRKGAKMIGAIQVAADVDDPRTREREIKGLLDAMEELKLKEGLIITEDYQGEEEFKGKRVRFIPLWKWLLVQ